MIGSYIQDNGAFLILARKGEVGYIFEGRVIFGTLQSFSRSYCIKKLNLGELLLTVR